MGEFVADEEIAWIDSLEANLPVEVETLKSFDDFAQSNDEIARIRAEIQVASQQCQVVYVENLQTLLRNIGSLRRPSGVMWCNFGVFGMDNPGGGKHMPEMPTYLTDRRERRLAGLYNWLLGKTLTEIPPRLRDDWTAWVYETLRDSTQQKKWLVGNLCIRLKQALNHPWLSGPKRDTSRYTLGMVFGLNTETDDAEVLGRTRERIRLTEEAKAILDKMGRLEICHFRFERWMDNQIMMIGQMHPHARALQRSSLTVEDWLAGIGDYVKAINAWIDDIPQLEVVERDVAEEGVVARVYSLLGLRSPVKVWLAASLSKTIRSIGEDPLRLTHEPPPQAFLTWREGPSHGQRGFS